MGTTGGTIRWKREREVDSTITAKLESKGTGILAWLVCVGMEMG